MGMGNAHGRGVELMTTYWWSSRLTAKDVAHLSEEMKQVLKDALDDTIMAVCLEFEVR